MIGRAVDGYLANCRVYVDLNDNAAADPGEPAAETDAFGGFVLPMPPPGVTASVRVETTVETTTGDGAKCVDTFTRQSPGLLSLTSARVTSTTQTSAAVTVVTPLTTVAAALARKYVVSTTKANTLVARAFGVPNGTDISLVDPIGAVAAGGGSDGSAAALVVAGAASDLREGVEKARESIDSGAAKEKIAAVARITTEAT